MTQTPTENNWDADYAEAEAETLEQLTSIEHAIGTTPAVMSIRESVAVTMRVAYDEKTAAIRADRDAKAAQIVELKASLAKKD